MEDLAAQIERIKAKLPLARFSDPTLTVFGASSHRYHLNAPVTEEAVRAFEQTYGLDLPADYRQFVTQVGNGGRSFRESAAGPHYGIYPLGAWVDDVIEEPDDYLWRPNPLEPDMPEAHWQAVVKALRNSISDEVFTAGRSELFQGLLPIGSRGCNFTTMLVVSGPYKGRLLCVDYDLGQPCFMAETRFLDWYERWLNDILLGKLQSAGLR